METKCLKCEEAICDSQEINSVDCYLCKRWAHAPCFDIDEVTINNFRSIKYHGFRWICPGCVKYYEETDENRDKKTDELQSEKLKRKGISKIRKKKTPKKVKEIIPNYKTDSTEDDEDLVSSETDDDYILPEPIKTSNSKRKKRKKITDQTLPTKDPDTENAESADGEKPFSCSVCRKAYSTKNSLEHHLKLHEGKFKCDDCGLACVSSASLEIHRRRHTGEKQFSCDVCDKRFKRNGDAMHHKRTIHPDAEPLQCDTCHMIFTTTPQLRRHEKILHGTPCSVCGQRFLSKTDLRKHFNAHDDSEKPVFVCHICGKSFFNKYYLTSHLLIHKGEKPHLCDICGKGFLHSGSLIRHKELHVSEKFTCQICSKKFSCNSNLKAHQKVHVAENELTCNICHKRFAFTHGLKKHLSIHTGEKPHPCSICLKRFRTKQGLKQHMGMPSVHAGFVIERPKESVVQSTDCRNELNNYFLTM